MLKLRDTGLPALKLRKTGVPDAAVRVSSMLDSGLYGRNKLLTLRLG